MAAPQQRDQHGIHDAFLPHDNPTDLFRRYFGFKEALEALFGRAVDLVMIGAMRNPYFIESVNKTRRLIYEAQDAQAA